MSNNEGIAILRPVMAMEKTMTKRMNIRLCIYFLILLGAGIFLSRCVTGPGELTLQSVEADRELGQETAQLVAQQIGIVDDADMTAYLNAIGQQLVRAHTDQRFDYSFQIVDQFEPNAFAAPGGYIFVSRGLLALANNEDELANVIGHEIIHVSRRHIARQMAKQRVPSLLSLPGRVVGRVVSQNIGALLNAPIDTLGAAYIAKHSRKDEFEADRLGQRLSAQTGYDPVALAPILGRLEQESQLRTGEQRRPGFFDTHPTTPDRVSRVTRDAQKIEWSRRPGVVRDSAEFLRQLDGLLIGTNPAEGVFQGRKFLQPVLDFSIVFPKDWIAMNTRQAVVAMAKKRDAVLILGIQGEGTDPGQAAAALTQALHKEFRAKPTRSESARIGNLPAHLVTYSDTSGKEPMHLHFLWVAYRGLIYQFIGLAAESYRPTLRDAALSFKPLTSSERASIKETRLRIVSARANETLDQLNKRTRNVWDVKTTSVMNGIKPGQPLQKGQLVKIAVLQPYRGPMAR
ncbi:MAG: M48 family metalloprotease [Phycisphaerales bacterium]|jgi:predicted Zn-dependent protease